MKFKLLTTMDVKDSWEFNVFDEPESIAWANINTTDTCVPENCDGSAELEIDFDLTKMTHIIYHTGLIVKVNQ